MINHLWQSTVFAAWIALACFLLRRHSPRLRYWLWLAASLKFLVPFSLLMQAGATFEPTPTAPHAPVFSAAQVEQLSVAFAPLPPAPATPSLGWLWGAGGLAVVAWRGRQWLTLSRARRAATPVALADFPVPALATEAPIEPGIFGLLRPVLLVPRGLFESIGAGELEAILAHERCHVRHRDNLSAALHMITEAAFWFHPLVWWIGARLIAERERHCDESVLAAGGEAETYARGILNVCRLYVPAPLPCAAGVTGADLKQRIRDIMTARLSQPLSRAGQAALAAAVLAAVSAPLVVGVLRAQTLPPAPQHGYEVATIRPSKAADNNSRIGPGPQGGMRATNVTIMQLVGFAYDLRPFQVSGAPGWANSDRWDVSFTPDKAEKIPQPGDKIERAAMEGMFERQRQRMQAVLRDRVGLVLRIEKKEMPYLALVEAKGGHKMKAGDKSQPPMMRNGPGRSEGNNVYMTQLTNALAAFFERPVLNESTLDGPFSYVLEYQSSGERAPNEADRAAVLAQLPEQIGLRLEARKGPVPVYVVEKLTKPDAN